MTGDTYKYFRTEARELLDSLLRGVLELEKGRGDAELLGGMLRQAHTLKGAARVVRQTRIADLSHAMEEVLAAQRDHPHEESVDRVRKLLACVDSISAELAALDRPAEQRPAAQAPHEHLETVRVDVQDLDSLLQTVGELRAQTSGLLRQMAELQQAARQTGEPGAAGVIKNVHRTATEILGHSDRDIRRLFELATTMRLVAANTLFPSLERAARDAAEESGKDVAFETVGGEVRLDARALRLLRQALIHLVRNAVTHGIEPSAERVAAGKQPAGSVRIAVERLGDRAIFRCSDDGRGVDVERVRQAVVAQGRITSSEADRLTPPAAMDLLLRGGISTTLKVSQLAGRGVGLEVVRDTAAGLHGTVSAKTQPGRGTQVELSVPVMVESQEVLHVQAADAVVAIPRLGVREAIRVASADIATSPEGQSILCGGRAMPFLPLGRLIGGQGEPMPTMLSALVLESPAGAAAVGVDRILGSEQVVIRPIPAALGPAPLLSGAILDSQGDPQLVLNVEGLVQAVHAAAPVGIEARASRLPLLVIDDSLTTRMLEQGILETAGYEVDTAASGEEAFAMARRRQYGLFLVDVEMPGMNGFDFIRAVKADPQLAAVPSILVSSRDSERDQAEGRQVGAVAYIIKSAFDERLLLRIIRELVG